MVIGWIILGIAAVAVAATALYLALKDSKKDADDNFSKTNKVGDKKTNCPLKNTECDVKIEVECRLVPKGKTLKFKAVGTPAGGNLIWTTSGHVSIVGANNKQVVEVKNAGISAKIDDSELKVQYSCGKGCSDSIKLTAYEIAKIKAKVLSTPSARTGTSPPEYNEESTESGETFDRAKTLIVLRGNFESINFEVEVAPTDTPIGWDVVRAADDHASLGASVPKLTINGVDKRKAELETNETGSFSIRAFGDCGGTGKYDLSQDMKLFPLVVVRARLHKDNSVSHSGHIAASVAGGMLQLNAGSFDITKPATEAMHMNATIDVVSGGPNGRRHIDCVFGGWVNNMRQSRNNVASYVGSHTVEFVFTTTAVPSGSPRVINPGDPAPTYLGPPILDTGRGSAGTGGVTAALTSSRIRSRNNRPVGQRWTVEAIDSPGIPALLTHPGHATKLQKYVYNLPFAAHLALWTNKTRVDGASGDVADRVYAVVRSLEWTMEGEWTVSAAGAVTTVKAMSVPVKNRRTHNPTEEADNVDCEVRPPSALTRVAFDARA